VGLAGNFFGLRSKEVTMGNPKKTLSESTAYSSIGSRNPVPKDKRISGQQRRHLPHLVIVGGMALSLGTTIVTGFKKSGVVHVVSAFCFVGLAMSHLFMHRRQLSHRVKNGLHLDGNHVSPATITYES
jgi:hypothetical protein